jgi:hypothetical protein
MGGGNSVENISNTLTRDVTKSAISASSSVSQTAIAEQRVKIDCADVIWQTQRNKYINQCRDTFFPEGKPSPWTATDYKNICESPWQCGASNVTLQGTLKVTFDATDISTIKTEIKDNLNNAVNQASSQTTGPVTFKDSEKSTIKSQVESVTNQATSVLQKTIASAQQMEFVTVKSGTIKYISQTAVQTDYLKNLQSSSTFQLAVNNLSSTISQVSSQSQGSIGEVRKLLIYVVIGMISFMIFLGAILFAAKRGAFSLTNTIPEKN